MRRSRFGDDQRVQPMRQAAALTFEPERDVFPLAVEQRLVLSYKIPERTPRDVEAPAAERRLREVVVVGMKDAVTSAMHPAQEEIAMRRRKPKKKRGAAGSRGKASRARAVSSKRKKASAKKPPARKGSPARATKKVGTRRVGAKRAITASTKARAGTHTVTKKASAVIAQAVTTVRKALVGAAAGAAKGAVTGALHGAMTAVTPEPSPAGTASPQTSGEQPGGEPGR